MSLGAQLKRHKLQSPPWAKKQKTTEMRAPKCLVAGGDQMPDKTKIINSMGMLPSDAPGTLKLALKGIPI